MLLTVVSFASLLGGLCAQDVQVQSSPTEDAPASPQEEEAAPQPAPKAWNRFESKWVSGQIVGGVFLDFYRYAQSETSRNQVGDLGEFEQPEIRAFRAGVGGTINFKNPWTWVIGGAYRGFEQGFDRERDDTWALFDLALTIPVPKLGRVKIGKMKEPISMERLMPMVFMAFQERSMGNDAMLPARNIGIQIQNSFARKRMTFTGGWFNDWLESGESFREGSNQYIGRLTGLPVDDGDNLVHLAVSSRYSDVKPGILRFKTRPELFYIPNFVDTDYFSAEAMTYLLTEAHYRRGRLWVASEQFFNHVRSEQNGDPLFWSFFVQAAWTLTGEVRPYDRERGIFRPLTPKRPVSEGGPGLWQLAVRYSQLDLTAGSIEGGKISKLAGSVNWYYSQFVNTAFDYGVVRLDRRGMVGYTQVFQLRLGLMF